MAYVKIIFQDSPSTATPLNAANLNHMDDGIAENDRRLNELETAGVVNTFNGRSGTVVPDSNDYDINQIGATDGQDGYVPVWRNNGTPESPNWSFNMEEQGGSGHAIEDSSGTAVAQEPTLSFPDAGVSDDALNQKTVVEVIQEVADISTPTADGIYVCDDGNDVPIGDIEEDYVEVEADGDKTRAQLLAELDSLVVWSKITENSYIVFGNDIYRVNVPNVKIFMTSAISNGHLYNTMFDLNNHISQQFDTTTSTTSLTDYSSNKPTRGRTITLYYGSSKAIVNLLTDAGNCMLDPQTSVKQAIVRTESNIAPIESSTTASQNYAVGDQFILNGLLYKATAQINQGGTILPNGNCALSSSVTDQLSKVTAMPNLTIQSPHMGAISGKRIGTNFGFIDVELTVLDSSALNHNTLIVSGMALPIESMFLTLPMLNGQNLNCVLTTDGELRTYYPGATALGRVDHNFIYPLKTAYY